MNYFSCKNLLGTVIFCFIGIFFFHLETSYLYPFQFPYLFHGFGSQVKIYIVILHFLSPGQPFLFLQPHFSTAGNNSATAETGLFQHDKTMDMGVIKQETMIWHFLRKVGNFISTERIFNLNDLKLSDLEFIHCIFNHIFSDSCLSLWVFFFIKVLTFSSKNFCLVLLLYLLDWWTGNLHTFLHLPDLGSTSSVGERLG